MLISKNLLKKFLGKFDKFIVLFLASVVFVSFLVILALGVFKECLKTKSAIIGYLEAKTKNEQIEHSVKIKAIFFDIRDDVAFFDSYIAGLESPKSVDLEKKKEFLLGLRKIEEEAAALENEFSEYFNDNSIQYSPFADGQITSEIYEAHNFGIVLKRFARQSEIVLLGSPRVDEQQGKLLAEQYYEVVWYVDKLAGGISD